MEIWETHNVCTDVINIHIYANVRTSFGNIDLHMSFGDIGLSDSTVLLSLQTFPIRDR